MFSYISTVKFRPSSQDLDSEVDELMPSSRESSIDRPLRLVHPSTREMPNLQPNTREVRDDEALAGMVRRCFTDVHILSLVYR